MACRSNARAYGASHAVISISAGNCGDRAGRCDDSVGEVRSRLAIYAARTAPLVDHYRAKDARIITVPVTADMSADAMYAFLESHRP